MAHVDDARQKYLGWILPLLEAAVSCKVITCLNGYESIKWTHGKIDVAMRWIGGGQFGKTYEVTSFEDADTQNIVVYSKIKPHRFALPLK